MHIEVESTDVLLFESGDPVRSASAIAALGDGFLVVQDDATHAAWFRDGRATAVRLLPPVEGLELFDERSGTKHLKPDFEAACSVLDGHEPAVLVLGSGSSPGRMQVVLVHVTRRGPRSLAAELESLYALAADVLGVDLDVLNLEGACILDRTLRWFHRGLQSTGQGSGSVDLDLADVLAAVHGQMAPHEVTITGVQRYDLGRGAGVGLAITDAVTLPSGQVLCSAAAEDSPNARDDGPVVASALVRLGEDVLDVAALPLIDGAVVKVEGLMLLDADGEHLRLLAVVDGDDARAPSLGVRLRVRL